MVVIRAPAHFAHDPVAQRYEELFRWLDWSVVGEKDDSLPQPGRLPHLAAAYLKAYLVMVNQKPEYHTDLYNYLRDHPALVWLIGFRLVANAGSPYGFDVASSVPTARHLRRKLGTLNPRVLAALLAQTVKQAVAVMPGVGETVSVDIKHLYAQVKQNDPRVAVTGRYDPTCQPAGDPDCRLGVKRYHNQGEEEADEAPPDKEYLWGYGTGVAVTQTADKDALVVGELTQPFNANDVTYGLPLLDQARCSLGFPPRHVAADAAFDAWYMYQGPAELGGIAAIALNLRGDPPIVLGPHDRPRCSCNG